MLSTYLISIFGRFEVDGRNYSDDIVGRFEVKYLRISYLSAGGS